MPSITAKCVSGAPSTLKCPGTGTRMFVAPSSMLPSGMCGSKRPKTDTMRPLTDDSRPSITMVSSLGSSARTLGSMMSFAKRDPANGVQIATMPSSPRVPSSPDTSRCFATSPPLLCATTTRPAGDAGTFASARPSRRAVSAMPRRLVPMPCTTRTR